MNYDALHNLKVQEYEHPGEQKAMAAMRSIPGADVLVGKYWDVIAQFENFGETAANGFRITEKTNPRVYKLYQTALARLDMPREYPLYATLNYEYNAAAVGTDNPIIEINSSVIADFSDSALLALIGHELGHIKSGHTTYRNLAFHLNDFLHNLGGIAETASAALYYAIMEVYRNQECTCDRAGLIACGSIEGFTEFMMRLLGYSGKIPGIDFSYDKVINQIDDFYMQTNDIIGKLMYVYSIANATHPWTVLRLKEGLNWYNSGEFEALVKRHM